MSSYCDICVLKLLYVSSYYVVLGLFLLLDAHGNAVYVSSYCDICVLILRYMCPQTAVYVSSYYYMCSHNRAVPASRRARQRYICVLILLYMCPHNTMCPHTAAMYLSSYYYMCSHTVICVLILLFVLILLYVSSYYCMCPHTAIYMSSYC